MVLSERRTRVIVGLGGVQAIVDGALDVLLVVLAIELLGIGGARSRLSRGNRRGRGLSRRHGSGWACWPTSSGAIAVGRCARPRVAHHRWLGFSRRRRRCWRFRVRASAWVMSPVALSCNGWRHARSWLVSSACSRGWQWPGLPSAPYSPRFSSTWSARQGAFVVLGLLLPVAAIAGWPMIRAADISAYVPEVEVGILERVAMLRLLDPPALEALALGSHVEEVEEGRVVIRQGDAGDRVYVIDAGRYDVIADGHLVNTLESGDIFGEIALIADVPRTATVSAVEDGRLLAIDRATFLETLAQCPGTLATFEEVVGRRLSGFGELG